MGYRRLRNTDTNALVAYPILAPTALSFSPTFHSRVHCPYYILFKNGICWEQGLFNIYAERENVRHWSVYLWAVGWIPFGDGARMSVFVRGKSSFLTCFSRLSWLACGSLLMLLGNVCSISQRHLCSIYAQ